MKEYTMVLVDLATGASKALPGVENGRNLWPGSNFRSKDDSSAIFQELVESADVPTRAPAAYRWHPVSITPMGAPSMIRIGNREMSVNPTVLVLMEREWPYEEHETAG